MKQIFAMALLLAGPTWLAAVADENTERDEAAPIREVGAAYLQAFNARDAEKLAEFWSPEAVYTNRQTGEQVTGREEIAKQFTALFENVKDLKLEIEVETIDFVSPNVAVERGVAKFLSATSEPEEISYSAVYVRHGGKWLLDRVTDEPVEVIPSHYEQLKDLEWMIGSWVDEDDSARIVTECNWTKNKNFITRSFSVAIDDRIDLSGIQIIGWDASENKIRSWTFDSDGGFSQGSWTKSKDKWFVRKRGTTADGRKATAMNIVTVVDEDTFTLQSTQRTVGGELLPNVNEVIVVRQ